MWLHLYNRNPYTEKAFLIYKGARERASVYLIYILAAYTTILTIIFRKISDTVQQSFPMACLVIETIYNVNSLTLDDAAVNLS